MSDVTLKKELTDAIEAIRAARADDKITVVELIRIIAEVLDVSAAAVGGYIGDDAKFEQFVKDVEDVVREYVVKPDLPRVPDLVENIIDSQLIAWVRPLLMAVRLERNPVIPDAPVTPDKPDDFNPVN